MKGRNILEQEIAEIYQKHFEEVSKYLFCLCHDKALVEDLAQETFICATFGIKKFRKDCKIEVWLCQIAKNLWSKELRRRKKLTVISMDAEVGEIGADINLEDEFIDREDRMILYKQLDKLDSSTKELMYLKLTTELSFIEISQVLGKSESWVRVTYYRTKEKLMKMNREEEKENETK